MSAVKAERVIEARDMTITPGFIDTHAHSEFMLLADPRAEGKICQGITTEINGNCGLSAAPLYGETLKQREGDLEELDIRERWTTFKEYFEILERRGVCLNFVTLAGHGNIRSCVAGYQDRKLYGLGPQENAAAPQGCCRRWRDRTFNGIDLSARRLFGYGRTDRPLQGSCRIGQDVSGTNRHNRPLGKWGKRGPRNKGSPGIYTSHMRSEGDKLIESVEETIRIAKESGIKVHISHIKTSGKKNWHKIDKVLSIIATSKNEGLGVTADRYPYTAASTDLDTISAFMGL